MPETQAHAQQTEPRLALEMTFRHIGALDALMDHTRRCFADVEAVLPETVLCCVTVQPSFVHGSARAFEAEVRLVGRSLAADVHHVGSDLFDTVSEAACALRERVELRHSGVWELEPAQDRGGEPSSQAG